MHDAHRGLPRKKVSDESLSRDETSCVRLATKLSQVTVNLKKISKFVHTIELQTYIVKFSKQENKFPEYKFKSP